ncbi:MAG TPA: alpha/beta hydrolase [Mucilaginibacter sp.]|nr:alpha/beta hydrolase [Mucilaginibacter sp.]
MKTVYLIPGLGADSRIYKKIIIDDAVVIKIDWIEPEPTDTLTSYAKNLIDHYNIQVNSVVIGNSLGGMIAMEISKIIPLSKTILISSVKTKSETPAYFPVFKFIGLYKLASVKFASRMKFLLSLVFGKMKGGEMRLFTDMIEKSSPKFIKWATKAVLDFDNQTIMPGTYTVIGDKDKVFNYRRIKDAIIIPGGTHIMIFDKADQVNKILKGILTK